eukprot:11526919-Ditylum_brightwellii.AAC.1
MEDYKWHIFCRIGLSKHYIFYRTYLGGISNWELSASSSESGAACEWKHDPISRGDAWPSSLQWELDVILMDAYEEDKPSTNTLDHLNRVQLCLG